MDKKQLLKYRNYIVYQVYPKSFADSNGDGVGDLRGIISKLDYIKSLHVDAVWLSPCFPSPGEDNGYDISNYTDIAPEFGTLADMDELIAQARQRGMGIILDLVVNHTSSAHPWFQASRKDTTNDYADYYYWSDEPLNGWQSAFGGGSAWIYDECRKQYYLASYAPSQPDLNWTNPKVRKAMQAVVDFWVARGVSGFRCDVLDQIAKDFQSPTGNGNGPLLHDYIRELFDRETTKNIFTVGECWSSSFDNIQKLCGLDRRELCCTFQDDHRAFGYAPTDRYRRIPHSLKEVTATLCKWQRATIDKDILYSLFWENHDSPRIVSRFGDENKRYESSTMLATMLFLLCGVVFLYEGQELGLTNTAFSRIEDFRDIETKNLYRRWKTEGIPEKEIFKRINFLGRDNGRRMMPWTTEKLPAWIPTDERHLALNVEAQEADEGSVLHYFRALLALRKRYAPFRRGDFQKISLTEEHFVYERAFEGERFTVVCNFDKPSKIDGLSGEILLSNLRRKTANGNYAPFECTVLKC